MRRLVYLVIASTLALLWPIYSLAQENFVGDDEIDSDTIETIVNEEDLNTSDKLIGVDDNSNESVDDNSNELIDDDSNELVDDNEDNILDFANISARFCNEGVENLSDSLKAAVEQGSPFKVCIVLDNNGDVDADIAIRVVDKVVNAQGYEVCNYNSLNIQNFISEDDLNKLSKIHIPAHNYIIKEFFVTFPLGVGGEQKSCFTYHLINKTSEEPSMLNVIYNRYHDMDFFVGNVGDIINMLDINDIDVRLNGNKFLELAFNIDNIGNLESQVVINGTISNIFGFNKDFSFDVGNIGVGGSLTGIIDLGSLPSYGGLFNITMTATSTPYFSYNVDSSLFEKDLLESKDFTIKTSYFVMPRLIIIIAVLLLLFLIILLRKPKQKVVYVQTPQQPTPNNGYNAYQQPQYQVQQPQVAQPQYQQPQVAQPQYQQPQVQPQYGQPTQDPNSYGQPNQQ